MKYQSFNPNPLPRARAIPAGSVDAHMHVFGPQAAYPYSTRRSYTPKEALLGDYLRIAGEAGIERTVVVQPSIYGTDNRAARDAVKRLGPHRARGVAVVSPAVTDKELEALHEEGFRGVRMNLLFEGGIGFEAVKSLAPRLAALGWHIQFLIDVSTFPHLYERLSLLPTDVVIDHMGHMPAHKGVSHPGFQALLRLARTGRCWVKLSAPYRITGEARAPYQDAAPLARALMRANPERMIWGSDWPHPQSPVPPPGVAALAAMLANWAADGALLRKILVSNPEALYGF